MASETALEQLSAKFAGREHRSPQVELSPEKLEYNLISDNHS
ncbi:hypothetical protein MOTE_19080 [Moorella thermoacetica]|uniref:Uncharacterized protein n=1 Tax=Neomoorella thermoacetica TaxID=1525 RepID=A0A1J5NI67_NEOTH|nr:hypothetical protein MOTE_19080 [Moorella thermoacetica]